VLAFQLEICVVPLAPLARLGRGTIAHGAVSAEIGPCVCACSMKLFGAAIKKCSERVRRKTPTGVGISIHP
jgi:hypothetical protein